MSVSQLCCALLMIMLSSVGCATTTSNDQSNDRILLESLRAKDLSAAKQALENGADPEAILGRDLGDHAVCTAIDDRSSRFLELLIEYGASTNAFWDVGHSDRRTPLACAVYLWNFEAFEYLLNHGADPSVDLVPEASERFRNHQTAFTMALRGSKYPMALRLLGLYELHPAELEALKYYLENSPYSEAHPWNYAREALIDWTRARVPDFNPKPAHPSPDGVTQECLFTFRDHEEGLKKGTLCPRPEDLRQHD
ncbi:ankyrin repeat domain-containing protein [Granulosicoccus sp. 3-233]|uniref:ankyrin repeat domain-containing protein n=1 Tax=Granulosicoccus sp. 3-233 TaxID=3417969 RepID=UPI003D34033A